MIYRGKDMNDMELEELREISLHKGHHGNASMYAREAQILLWLRSYSYYITEPYDCVCDGDNDYIF